MPKASTGIVVAQDAFVAELGGETFDVQAGDLFEADHPLPAKYPHLFRPPRFRFPARGVEQATAAPGQKRGA